MDDREHLDLLGTLSIVFGVITAVMAFIVFVVLTLVTGFLPSDVSGMSVFLVVMLVFLGAGILAALCGVVGGMDLRARRARGRILVLVFAAVSLLSFPVGTAYGVYAIWVLTRPAAEAELGGRPSGA